jgi:hypothetical protein
LAGEAEATGENWSQRRFVHHTILHDLILGSNPALYGVKPATNISKCVTTPLLLLNFNISKMLQEMYQLIL